LADAAELPTVHFGAHGALQRHAPGFPPTRSAGVSSVPPHSFDQGAVFPIHISFSPTAVDL